MTKRLLLRQRQQYAVRRKIAAVKAAGYNIITATCNTCVGLANRPPNGVRAACTYAASAIDAPPIEYLSVFSISRGINVMLITKGATGINVLLHDIGGKPSKAT